MMQREEFGDDWFLCRPRDTMGNLCLSRYNDYCVTRHWRAELAENSQLRQEREFAAGVSNQGI
jgi:hypothetical protein